MLRALEAHIRNYTRPHTSKLTADLYTLEKEEITSKRRRQQEIIKLWAEINKIEIDTQTRKHKESMNRSSLKSIILTNS